MFSMGFVARVGAAAALVALTGGLASAATVDGVSVNPTSLTIQEGASGLYSVAVTSVSGNIPATTPNAPALSYCSEWTIHSDLTISCDSRLTIPLARGRNYNSNPLTPAEVAALTRTVTVNVDSGLCGESFTLVDTLTLPTGSGTDFGDSHSLLRSVTVTVTCDDVAFGGCSHGYWKNHQGQWPAAYVPATTLGSVFAMGGTYASLSTKTFADALEFGGGNSIVEKAQLLLLQAVAALLNAEHADIVYEWTAAEIVGAVDAALASEHQGTILQLKDRLDAFNNYGSLVCVDSH